MPGEGAVRQMNYHAYELAHALLAPWRLGLETLRAGLDHPLNPLALWPHSRGLSAACEIFEKVTRRYGKPAFGIKEAVADGRPVAIREEVIAATPFCTLRRFARDEPLSSGAEAPPQVLLVAPMSGHYATLLRGTIAGLAGAHDVYVTDWSDARDVPLIAGPFGLEHFIDHVIEHLSIVGPQAHLIGISQSSVPALAATALLAARNDPIVPTTLTLLGGPIDTRVNPTAVNRLIEDRSRAWFEAHAISLVPMLHAGAMRRVYPGFMQLTGFMTMDLDRHWSAHVGLFYDLVRGDRDSLEQHRAFYEDYMAVMDLTAEFFLDTVDLVFQKHALPKGELSHRGARVDCGAIRSTVLTTAEAERDVICGAGQTHAAHVLCRNLPDGLRHKLDLAGAGHFGLFNGTRWRTEIAPFVARTIAAADWARHGAWPEAATANIVRLPSSR